MTTPAHTPAPAAGADARDLQSRLYREIGISAVAAALHFTKQPEPGTAAKTSHPLPALLREEEIAA